MIVIHELCGVEEVQPIILSVVAKGAEISFKPLVVVLNLALCLGVVCHGESLVDTKGLKELTCVVCREHAASVRVVDTGYSVGFPYVL